MQEHISLSALADQIQSTIQNRFEQESYWVSARIMNVKKYTGTRRCYLNLEESVQGMKVAEMKAVFWSNYYSEIEKFEKYIQQPFKDGTEIICKVKVRFHKVYGLNLDVIQIDVAHTLGTLELERQQLLERLLKENPNTIKEIDGIYMTYNKSLALEPIIKNIALITAPNSDGQRDFQQELINNKYGYAFQVSEFLCTIQGENAHELIVAQLEQIQKSKIAFDAVAIVRGGGSLSDFKPFDTFELANKVANFTIPIFTGIGHDRNQSIVDLMAREYKTPTKVAAQIIDHNFEFENSLLLLQRHLLDLVDATIQEAQEHIKHAKSIVKLASPDSILKRGFAIVSYNNNILTDASALQEDDEIETQLKNKTIISRVKKIRS